MGLNHVALTVSDRKKSADFYKEYFGFYSTVHEDDHLLILADTAGGLLALSKGDVPADLSRTNHFGSQLDSTQAVLAARETFRRNGVIEAEFQEHGPTRVQVFDPDGYRVEVYAF